MVAAWTVGRILIAEALHRRAQPRLPGTVRAPLGQAMTPGQVLHVAQAGSLIQPGDRVLELGCGCGAPLIALAQVHPDASFVGVDAQPEALDAARHAARAAGVSNIRWFLAEISALDRFADDAFDVIASSFALHRLSATRDLRRAMVHGRRMLSRGGRIYLADFLRPRAAGSIQALARLSPSMLAHDGPDLLRAAFTADQLHHVTDATGLLDRAHARQYVARPLPLVQVIQSAPPGEPTPELARTLAELCQRLTDPQRRELDTLVRLLQRGGLDTLLAQAI